jgi:SAM-dependent methyltransferase
LTSESFDEVAPIYDDAVQRSIDFVGQDLEVFTRRKVEVLLRLARRAVGDPHGLRVLDAGCGVGVTDELLVGRVGELHGIDVSGAAVEQAEKRNPSVSYQTMDGTSFGHPDATFDLTFAICVVHHVDPGPARDVFFSELRRVTRPGGLVAVFEHNPINPLTRVAVSRCDFDEGVELLRRKVVCRSLQRAGLEVVTASYILFSPIDARPLLGLERALGWLPLGAQYVVAARVPSAGAAPS